MIKCNYCRLPATSKSFNTGMYYCEEHWNQREELLKKTSKEFNCKKCNVPLEILEDGDWGFCPRCKTVWNMFLYRPKGDCKYHFFDEGDLWAWVTLPAFLAERVTRCPHCGIAENKEKE